MTDGTKTAHQVAQPLAPHSNSSLREEKRFTVFVAVVAAVVVVIAKGHSHTNWLVSSQAAYQGDDAARDACSMGCATRRLS